MNNLFQQTLIRKNKGRPPVWLMRQAGRYHSHYQKLKQRYTFMELCKNSDAACEATMGPIDDFGFDAAILFSDLLFPLEAMGMGLDYAPGPKLTWHLRTTADLGRLQGGAERAEEMRFQADAMKKIRAALPSDRGLLGFVGGPLTLFYYAVEGSHQGALGSAHSGLTDGRYSGFCEKLLDLLVGEMVLQARAGADTIAVLDTCAGELEPELYGQLGVPVLKRLFAQFQSQCPETPITYYSKGTGPQHWDQLTTLPIAALGVDWRQDLVDVLNRYGDRFAIQGNIDPEWLLLPPAELEQNLRRVWGRVKSEVPLQSRQGWIAGLGHGVLQKTPEANVRLYMKVQREIFG